VPLCAAQRCHLLRLLVSALSMELIPCPNKKGKSSSHHDAAKGGHNNRLSADIHGGGSIAERTRPKESEQYEATAADRESTRQLKSDVGTLAKRNCDEGNDANNHCDECKTPHGRTQLLMSILSRDEMDEQSNQLPPRSPGRTGFQNRRYPAIWAMSRGRICAVMGGVGWFRVMLLQRGGAKFRVHL